MQNSRMSKVVQHLHSAALLGGSAELTDGQLLECFVSRHEEAALEALVRRHGVMVWGVCHRMLQNHHDAEDAFQATFLVLLRKATTIVPREMVGNWLYGVAHQTALKARATRAKQRAREMQVMELPEPATPAQQLWNDLQPILDQELSGLPDKYRAVFVLCELEGKTGREAARQLGVPEGTVASRLARARALLAKRLARYGLAVSGATLAALLSEQAASGCVPASVVSSTINAVTLVAAGNAVTAGAIPAKVAALTEAVLKAMLLNKLKAVTVVLVLLGVCALATGTGMLAVQMPLAGQQPEAKQGQPMIAEAGPTTPPEKTPNRVDRYGDPLPPGAIARLGTVRLRHSGAVNVVAFTLDGTALISGDEHGEMRLWDTATGKLLRTFVDPLHHRIGALAVSPDGKWFVSGIARLSLWNVADGTRADVAADYPFGVHTVASLAFAPDGKILAVTAEGDPLIRFYSVPAGKLLSQLDEGHKGTSYASAYSPDGKLLATAGVDRLVRVWDLATRKTRHQFKLPDPVGDVARSADTDQLRDVSWSADGKRLAAATKRTAFVWDVATETTVHEFNQGNRNLELLGKRSLAFSPDGKRLASIDRLWDLSSGKEVCQCEGRHTGGLSYAPDGKAVATAGDDGAVRLHDPDTGKELSHLRGVGGSGEFLWLGFAPDGQKLVALRGDVRPAVCEPGSGRLQSWTSDGREARELVIDGCGRSAAMSPDGAVFAMAQDGGALTVWDTVSGKRVRQLIGDDGKDKRGPGAPFIRPTFAFSPDSRFIASAGRGDKDIRVWEVGTGKLVQTLKGQSEGIYFLTFSGYGRRLVSTGSHDNGLTRFWDLATGKEWRPATALHGRVHGVSADGQTWALGSEESEPSTVGPLRICAVETGKELLRLEKGGHCAFAPDGRTVAIQADPSPSTEEEGESTIQLIELATGGVRTQFRGHHAFLETLVFAPDGKLLASGSSDNTALLWDLMGQGDTNQVELPTKQLQALWDQLGSDDAATAHQAMCLLARSQEQAVAWVREHLPPSQKADMEQVARLLQDLDSDRFAVREAAAAALRRLGELVAPALRQALDGKPSAEVRRRVSGLLEQLDRGTTPEQLRSLRVIEVLERTGKPATRKLLQELARGAPAARQTQEANASLDRLDRRQR
jgi:RNA polymerase sigma factor (sigma-70 family)